MTGRLVRCVEASWTGTDPAARATRTLLRPLAAAYGVGVAWRNRRFARGRVPATRVPAWVVSIGNLTVGGTGKTPTALWLADALHAHGRRVAIVARGYGKRRDGVVIVSRGDGPEVSAADGGDEAVMLAQRFRGPVVTAERRVEAALVAVHELGADTIVLDDGFQHRALARDVDLVLAPPRGAGTGLLPAGPFREPWSSLARAQAVLAIGEAELGAAPIPCPVFRGAVRAVGLVRAQPGEPWVDVPVEAIQGRTVTVVAGIAHPRRVVATVEALGARVGQLMPFPDHHAFGAADRAQLAAAIRREPVVCTEKDLVKLAGSAGLEELLAVRIALGVEDEARLLALLLPPVAGR